MTLTPVKTIDPPDWLRSPELAAIFAALQDENALPQILCVGGCVRNTLLGVEPGDIDLATIHTPNLVVKKLDTAGINTVPTGIDHGTVTAIVNKKPFEITTLRKDIETDGRHAVVGFTEDWKIDAQRRDFTMNTLLCDLQGRIYDPIRTGISDLSARTVRFVGDPAERLDEDVLRLLRFFRFHAQVGVGDPDPVALAACRNAAGRLSTLSRERIMQEFFKILHVGDVPATLTLMRGQGVMTDLIPADLILLRNVIAGQATLGIAAVEPRLAALLVTGGKTMALAETYFALSRVQKKRLELLLSEPDMGLAEMLYRFGVDDGAQTYLYMCARTGRGLAAGDMSLIRSWVAKTMPVSGADLKPLGVAEGERMGQILKQFERWWIDNNFPDDRARCLDALKTFVT